MDRGKKVRESWVIPFSAEKDWAEKVYDVIDVKCTGPARALIQ